MKGRCQTIAPRSYGTLSLPASERMAGAIRSPYWHTNNTSQVGAGRDIKFISDLMANVKVIISGGAYGATTFSPDLVFYQDDGTIVEDATGVIGVQLSMIDDQSSFRSVVISAIQSYASLQGYTITDYIWAINLDNQSGSRSFASPSRTLNSAFQVSTTRDAEVEYSVDIATSVSLSGGAVGTVFLEYADDSGFTTNVKECQRYVNGNTGTLVIGLTLNQTATAAVSGVIPAGKYVRIRTAKTTGTPTFTFRSAQEVLI